MFNGAGVYDDLCTAAREGSEAQGVILIIANGKHGSGFSVQGSQSLIFSLPNVLNQIAEELRDQAAQSIHKAPESMQ